MSEEHQDSKVGVAYSVRLHVIFIMRRTSKPQIRITGERERKRKRE